MWRDRNRPRAPIVGRPKHWIGSRLRQLPLDPDLRGVEVDVLPGEPAQFVFPHACLESQGVHRRRLHAGGGRPDKKLPRLVASSSSPVRARDARPPWARLYFGPRIRSDQIVSFRLPQRAAQDGVIEGRAWTPIRMPSRSGLRDRRRELAAAACVPMQAWTGPRQPSRTGPQSMAGAAASRS
jgi:hypothetical protein